MHKIKRETNARTARQSNMPPREPPAAPAQAVGVREPTVEELRLAMTRRLADILKESRRCPEPVCKRARACVSPRFTCATLPPLRKPRQSPAVALANLKRMLAVRMAELGVKR